MNNLIDYIEQAQTYLLNNCGAFFAFNNKQFNEQKVEGEKYVSVGAGLICPKPNCDVLLNGLKALTKRGIQKDIQENGIDAIILRELENKEAFYTQSIDDTVSALKGYPVTASQVAKVYSDNSWHFARC